MGRNFSNDVDKIIQKLLKGGTSNWSPIFEMIQAVNISSFKHSNENYKNSNRLFIFSDFKHNTKSSANIMIVPIFQILKKTIVLIMTGFTPCLGERM